MPRTPRWRRARLPAETASAAPAVHAVRSAFRDVPVPFVTKRQRVSVHRVQCAEFPKLYVDFNDHVRKGQLLATIDPTLQQGTVEDAQAQLERAQAQLSLAQSEYSRNKQLFDAQVLSASEFATTQSNFSVQQAAV